MNTLDSVFCRGCGQPLDERRIAEARSEVERATSEGYSQFNNGNIDQAMRVATSCLEWDASSTAAISLMGMCHERNRNLAEALKCYEKVLELNPSSALDKIKVDQLRQMLGEKSTKLNPELVRKIAVGAALGAVLLSLGGIGAGYFINSYNRKPELSASTTPVLESEEPKTKSFGDVEKTDSQKAPAPATTTDQTQNTPPAQSNSKAQAETTPNPPTQQNTNANEPSNEARQVPKPVVPQDENSEKSTFKPNPIVAMPDPTPVKPDIVIMKPQQGSKDPDPTPVKQSGNSPAPKKDEGIMEISVTRVGGSGNRKIGGSEDVTSNANKVLFLTKAATDSFQAGNYARAAKDFEGAIKAGGETGKLRYRLGQCYERMGKKADAARNFTKAADLYESQIKGGAADKDRLSNLVEVCRQSAKLMGG